ncbi:RNA polymerase subunit sigma [Pseudomonas sp. C27(2019)]|uniref:MucB/RseB C-terminal domain-containing protein n=1 Tax=Pseudomonas sp. C27(2019) TaxID=2604941 RepID=UPI0012447D06|nr:MucB/RseB C-terminal domain-containing protein [Pseudomonas sp. C27(2019)]QEY58989.1 RNA polymerase subunit sigma [Pseudomonas sp. C27(2019)]
MQLKTLCSGAALWLALTAQAGAVQPESADHWLQRLQDAQGTKGTQGYQGAFVYERKGVFSTHQIWRQIDSQGRVSERFLQLNGPAHEVMRVDGRVTCISSAVAGELPAVDVWPTDALELENLQQWYQVRVLGESRVAGHKVAVLLFSPRDQYRYPVELSVDQATAIPLKSLLLNEQGQLLERLQFVQFQALAQQQSAQLEQALLTPSSACLPVTAIDDAADSDVESAWRVDWVPPGFTLLNSHSRQPSMTEGYMLSQVYSDGLAHFSVFLERINGLEIGGARRQIGPTAVVSKKIMQGAEALMVTVVGEIPLASAERVTLSVHTEMESNDD